MTLRKAFDGEVYYWYEDGKSRQVKSRVTATSVEAGRDVMGWAKYAKSWDEPHCRACLHTNPPEPDGSCSAYGYNGVDCQAQPCVCRNHIVVLHQPPLTENRKGEG